MQNPYVLLGVSMGATAEQIRAAYHARVKRCHPDGIADTAAKEAAQEELTRLNIAYEEAMRRAEFRKAHHVTIQDPKGRAKRLYERGQYDAALRMLSKAPDRGADWFTLQGRILLQKGEAEAAHACFRSAVRLEPDNTEYRSLALDAAVRMRKQKSLRGRMGGWARGIVGRML